MRQRLTALALCLFLCLTACTDAPVTVPEEPEFTPTPSATPKQTQFTLPYFPDANLHPILGSNRTNMVVNSLVYQGLFELDNSFTPHGVLCSDYSVSNDGLVWTFTLSDTQFSDGTPVTAADVALSLETARASTLYAGRLSPIQDIQVGTDRAVILTLTQPNSMLPSLLDIPVIHDLQDGSMPLGTGSYAFVEDDGPLRLIRTSRAPETAPKEIPLVAIDDADDLIYAFDAGNISLAVSDLTGSNVLGYSPGYEAFDFPTTTMVYVGFQTEQGPCADSLVRQAVSRSFDRDTVAGSLLAGHAKATSLPVSPYSTLYNSSLDQAGGYDPFAADELLVQAGFSEGENGLLYQDSTPLSLTFVVNTDNSFKLTIAEYLAGQLTDAGIDVDLKKMAWDDYLAALEADEFDLYLGEVTLTADFDLTSLLGPNGSLNYGGYTNTQMDSLRAFLRSSGKGNALLKLFQAEAPFAPLCFKNHSVLTQWQAISGLDPTRQNPFYHLESLRFGAEFR